MRNTNLILLGLALFLLLMLIRTCNSLELTEEQLGQYVSRRLDDSSTIHSQAVQLVQAGTKLKALELREPEVVIKYQTVTKLKTEIELGETVYIDSFPHLRLPRTFHRPGKWLEIGGSINRLGRLQIDSIIIPVSYTIAIGDTLRGGLLRRKRDKVVRLGIDNPYVQVTGMNNIIVDQPRKKWYQTQAFALAVGGIAGFAICRAK